MSGQRGEVEGLMVSQSSTLGWGGVWCVAAVCVCLITSPSQAEAQGGRVVEPSDAQIKLYKEGAEAFKAGDYAKSIDLFKASLHLGELNITYLNLGRAHFKLGQCDEALEAYRKAASSPQIAQPTPAQVQAKLEEYEADLDASCPATLIVECRSPSMKLYVGDEGPMACDANPMSLAPGQYVVRGEDGATIYEEQVMLSAMQKATLKLGAPESEEDPAEGDAQGGGSGGADRKKASRGARKLEPINPGLLFGFRGAFNVSGTVELTSRIEFLGASEETTTNIAETSGLSLNAYGLVALGDYLNAGLGLWFEGRSLTFPGNTGDDSPGVTTGEVEGRAFDINAMFGGTLPMGHFGLYVLGESGFSMMFFDEEGLDRVHLGFNFGGSIGAIYRLDQGFSLSMGVRFQNYQVNGTSKVEDIDLETTFSAQRILYEFGLAWGR